MPNIRVNSGFGNQRDPLFIDLFLLSIMEEQISRDYFGGEFRWIKTEKKPGMTGIIPEIQGNLSLSEQLLK